MTGLGSDKFRRQRCWCSFGEWGWSWHFTCKLVKAFISEHVEKTRAALRLHSILEKLKQLFIWNLHRLQRLTTTFTSMDTSPNSWRLQFATSKMFSACLGTSRCPLTSLLSPLAENKLHINCLINLEQSLFFFNLSFTQKAPTFLFASGKFNLTSEWVVLWCSLDYLVVPVKVLKSLQESKADLEDKYAFARRLSPSSAQAATFSEDEVNPHWWCSAFVLKKNLIALV